MVTFSIPHSHYEVSVDGKNTTCEVSSKSPEDPEDAAGQFVSKQSFLPRVLHQKILRRERSACCGATSLTLCVWLWPSLMLPFRVKVDCHIIWTQRPHERSIETFFWMTFFTVVTYIPCSWMWCQNVSVQVK